MKFYLFVVDRYDPESYVEHFVGLRPMECVVPVMKLQNRCIEWAEVEANNGDEAIQRHLENEHISIFEHTEYMAIPVESTTFYKNGHA